MIDNSYIESEDEQEQLLIDSNLTFERHVNSIYKKTSQKFLNALARITL